MFIPTLYGIGPRALSTWRAKLASMIRNAPPGVPVTAPAPAATTDTTDRLEHARELIIRAVAVLSPLDRDDADDADDARVTTARKLNAELHDQIERITRALGERSDQPPVSTRTPGQRRPPP